MSFPALLCRKHIFTNSCLQLFPFPRSFSFYIVFFLFFPPESTCSLTPVLSSFHSPVLSHSVLSFLVLPCRKHIFTNSYLQLFPFPRSFSFYIVFFLFFPAESTCSLTPVLSSFHSPVLSHSVLSFLVLPCRKHIFTNSCLQLFPFPHSFSFYIVFFLFFPAESTNTCSLTPVLSSFHPPILSHSVLSIPVSIPSFFLILYCFHFLVFFFHSVLYSPFLLCVVPIPESFPSPCLPVWHTLPRVSAITARANTCYHLHPSVTRHIKAGPPPSDVPLPPRGEIRCT